jgi:hypothetical protein
MGPYGRISLVVMSAAWLWCGGPRAQEASPADGPAIYRALSSQGILEDYLTPEVSEILGTLVQASGRWQTYGVNEPYRPGAVNVYLIDAIRLPEPSPLAELGIALDREGLSGQGGNARADEATGILFVDTGFLKSLVTVAMLDTQTELDTIGAVGMVRARGIDAFRTLWDPALNPRLRDSEYTDHWVLMASGAAAFALAHEMGHLAIGATDINKRRVPQRFANEADGANALACDALVQEWQRKQREIERAADDFAVDLLSRVLFPEGVLNEPKLRYEIGAEWYLVYSMAQQMVETLRVTRSDNIRRMLQIQFGPEVYAALSQGEGERFRNAVSVFFPESHPASIRRAAESLSRLAESPHSVARITGSSTGAQVAILEQLLATECRAIEERRGAR